jgi:hypothetical protein
VRRALAAAAIAAAIASGFASAAQAVPASVTIAGSFQSELGCPGDWQPDCGVTHLAYDAGDGVWQGSFALPSGSFEYRVAHDDSWTESYGANADPMGANLALALASLTPVKFYYDHETHWVVDDRSGLVAIAPGSFQSELGCPGDWAPDCLRSWLQDPDGDGLYGFVTPVLPAGEYEAKVTHGESWDENYGAGGAANGSNIPFAVPAPGRRMSFVYDPATHLLTIALPEPPRAALLAAALAFLGVRALQRDPQDPGPTS